MIVSVPTHRRIIPAVPAQLSGVNWVSMKTCFSLGITKGIKGWVIKHDSTRIVRKRYENFH